MSMYFIEFLAIIYYFTVNYFYVENNLILKILYVFGIEFWPNALSMMQYFVYKKTLRDGQIPKSK